MLCLVLLFGIVNDYYGLEVVFVLVLGIMWVVSSFRFSVKLFFESGMLLFVGI